MSELKTSHGPAAFQPESIINILDLIYYYKLHVNSEVISPPL